MTLAPGLISATDLAQQLAVGAVVVLDTRSGPNGAGRASFEAGHIPGARHTDYAADGWRSRVGNAPGKLPDKQHLAALIGRLGLTPDQAIVIVPAGQSIADMAAAARIFWTLRVAGLAPLALLDGGMPAWIAAGLPVEAGPAPTGQGPARLDLTLAQRATADAVLAAASTGTATLLDTRAPSFYCGLDKAAEARVGGHIPGALNVDYVTLYDAATNRLKPVADLARLLAGVPDGRGVIAYCNTGHTAALNWFVLSEVLGRHDVRLYDGSMTEWTEDPARPVATGSD